VTGNPPTKLCTACCWSGSTWVDCYVTTNAYPFNSNTTNTAVVWSGSGTYYYPGASSDRNGRANTAAISSTGTSAVQICKDLGTGWYLPAYEELINMTTGANNHPLNGRSGANLLATPAEYYWSSTELYNNGGRNSSGNQDYAVRVNFTGNLNYNAKTTTYFVRCAWRP
jgi:hypothetical protein